MPHHIFPPKIVLMELMRQVSLLGTVPVAADPSGLGDGRRSRVVKVASGAGGSRPGEVGAGGVLQAVPLATCQRVDRAPVDVVVRRVAGVLEVAC